MSGVWAALAVLAAGVLVRGVHVAALRIGRRGARGRPRRLGFRLRRGRVPPPLLPERLEAMARALRAGASLRSAIVASPSPDADPLEPVVRRIESGAGVADAVAAWAAGATDSRVRLAGAGVLAAAVVGGPQARVIDATALALRERAAEAAERRAHSAQAGASAAVLVGLPLAVGGWSVLTDRRVGEFLFTTAAGWACAVLGAVLIVIGAIWMQHLVRGQP